MSFLIRNFNCFQCCAFLENDIFKFKLRLQPFSVPPLLANGLGQAASGDEDGDGAVLESRGNGAVARGVTDGHGVVGDGGHSHVPVVGLDPHEGIPYASAYGEGALAAGGEEGEEGGEVGRYGDHSEAPF